MEVNFTDTPYLLEFKQGNQIYTKRIENTGYAMYGCVECEPGMFCELGSVHHDLAEDDKEPTKCPKGTYQPNSGRAYCIPCNIGAGENCPEASTYIISKPSAATCYGDDKPSVSSGFARIDSARSEIQCKQACIKRDDCAAFAWDLAVCYLVVFEEQTGFFEPGMLHESINPQFQEWDSMFRLQQ